MAFSEQLYDDAVIQFNELKADPVYRNTVPFYLAFIYNEKGEVEKAIALAESYLQQEDALHAKETLQFLASIYFNREDFMKSVALYEKARAMGIVLEPIQRYELGVGYHEVGKFSKAIELLKPLSVGKDSIAGQSMFYLGDSFLQIGDKTNARNSFMFSNTMPVSVEKKEIATLYFAKLSLELGFQDQGFQKLTDFISQFPNSILIKEAKEILLQYYAKTNDFKQALLLLEKSDISASLLSSIAPRIYFGRSMEIINENEYGLVEKYLNEILKYRSSSFYGPAIFWKGEISFRKENYPDAIKNLVEYTKLNASPMGEATNENAYYNLGYAHFEMESYDKAAGYFEKLFAVNKPIDSEFKREGVIRAADCAFMQKNISRAKSLYTKVSSGTMYGADYASFQLAVIEGIKEPLQKIKMLKKIQDEYPSSEYIPIITMELADTYMSEEDFENAIPFLEKIKTLVSKDDELLPQAYLKLGVCLYNLEKPDESIEQFKRLLVSYPASEQAAEAIESAKTIFIEKGRIDEYQTFLSSGGRSINSLQKDSLLFQFVQSRFIEPEAEAAYNAVNEYKNQFPNGLFIADVLNFQAELFQRDKKWSEAVQCFDSITAKGASKYQEKAYRTAAKIYFFELKDYANAIRNFNQLLLLSNADEIKLECLRGLVRSHYFMKEWQEGSIAAEKILTLNVGQDDKAYANIILGYKEQITLAFATSNTLFAKIISSNITQLTAEAGFQIASNTYQSGNLAEAETAAMNVIEKSGSNDFWVTRSYILLSDIFLKQKDYFNAKATLQSIIENCKIPELKSEAADKLKKVESEEKPIDK
jgi:tetratricopeptide (TPR) repeat protein